MTSEEQSGNPVEVREDIPLRPNDSVSFSHKFGGLRLIIASFTILTLAVTIALGIQIHYGDFEIVPHGSVATDSQECSRIGTDILKYGGTSIDAAISAAFCLAVVNQHTTGLDAGGVMMLYSYKHSRDGAPIIIDFSKSVNSSIPQLVRGLAFVHDKFGTVDWKYLLQPAIDLARNGFSIPRTLVAALESAHATNLFIGIEPGENFTAPQLASYLDNVANANTSGLYSKEGIFTTEASVANFDDYYIYTPELKSASIINKYLRSSNDSFFDEEYNTPDKVYKRAQNLKLKLEDFEPPAASSNIAVIDIDENYVSLVTGLHVMLGSQRLSNNGYILNEPASIPTNSKSFSLMVPIIITQTQTCGQRIVLSCGELGSAMQVVEYLISQNQKSADTLVLALESPRLHVFPFSTISIEETLERKYDDLTKRFLRKLGPLTAAVEPYATCNAVQQIGDILSSHSDSRGDGISSRF